MMRCIFRSLMLFLMVGMLSSCVLREADMVGKFDPSHKKCIAVSDALRLDGGASDGSGEPYTIPANGIVKTAAKPVVFLYTYVRYVTWASAKGLYEGISKNETFRNILTKLVSLMIIFYSTALLLGIVQYSLHELMMMTAKIAIVFTFALNWEAFETVVYAPLEGKLLIDTTNGGYTTLDDGAVAGMVKMVAFIGGAIEDESPTPLDDALGQIDNVMFMMVGWNYWKLIFALMSTGLQGWLYGALFTAMLITYFWALVSAFQVFLVSMIARCLLYSVAPLFFVCLLFKGTRQLFMGWAEQILSYSLQPILLFMWLGMINAHIIDFITAIPADGTQQICYSPFLSLSIVSIIPKLNWWIFTDDTKNNTELREAFAGVKMHFWFLVAAILLSVILHQMIQWTIQIAQRISGGVASVGGVEAIGYETVKSSVMSPFYQGFAFLGGAATGSLDDDGVKRRGGIGGAGWSFIRGKGFNPMYHIMGGAFGRARSVRRAQATEIRSIFGKEFGLTPRSGGKPPSMFKDSAKDLKSFTSTIKGVGKFLE